MHTYTIEIPPPKNEADFERMCAQVYGVVFGDPLPKINGRRGQAQGGVDVYVQHAAVGRIGIQCKKYYATKLKWSDVEDEVAEADKKKTPIKRLIFATTSRSDANIQKKVIELSDERKKCGLFDVEVEFWEDIENRIESRAVLQEQYAPNSAGGAFHRFGSDLAAVKEMQVSICTGLEASGFLPGARADSLNKLVTGQLDNTNALMKSGRYRDALDNTEALGKDLDIFDSHQRARWILQKGLCLWFLRDSISEAASHFMKAYETYPDDDRMAAARIRGLMLSEDVPAALKAGEEALQRHPESLQVWLAFANAKMAAGQKLEVADIPSGFRDEPDAVMFAALSLRENGDIEGALALAEQSAQLPTAGFFNRKTFLGLSLEACTKEPVLAQFGVFTFGRRQQLARATELLRPREERLWAMQTSAVSETAVHLGFAHLLLLNPAEALALVAEAKGNGFSDPELGRIELEALDQCGRRPEALAVAKENVLKLSAESLAVASEIAANNGDKKFIDTALEQAKARFPDQVGLGDYLRGLGWGAWVKAGNKEAAIDEILSTNLPMSGSIVLLCAAARILRWAINLLEASEMEDAALALVTEEATAPDRLLVAEMLYNAERWSDARKLYARLLDNAPPAVSDLHARLLTCLVESDLRQQAKALLESLPEGWAENDELRRSAIHLGQKAGDWKFLAPLSEKQVAKAPNEAATWLFRLLVMLRTVPPAQFQAEVRSVPEQVNGSIKNIARLAGLELHYDEQWRGLRRLYRLVRNNPDAPEAYSAYLTHFLVGQMPKLHEPRHVDAGTSISLDEETVIVDPDDIGRFPKAGHFLPCDDPLAELLRGSQVGDAVDVPQLAGGVRRMTVTSIQSSYAKIVEIAHAKARSLAGIPHMKLVSIGDTGNPEIDLAAMLAEIAPASEQRRRVLHLYGEQPITISMLAHAIGRTTVELVGGWLHDGPSLVVGGGHVTEREAALELLRRPNAVYVVDSMTLAELVLFDATEALGILPKLLITVPGKESVEALLAEDGPNEAFGSAFETNGKLEVIKYDDNYRARRLSFARSMNDAVSKYCEVVPSYGEIGGTPLSDALSKLAEGEEREILLLAKETGATILTVDGRLRQIARDALEVPSVWPQALVMTAFERGAMTQQAVSHFTIAEFFGNRSFVSLRSEDLLWMVAQGDSYVQHGFTLLKHYIAAPTTERESIIRVVLDFLEGITCMNTSLGAFGEILFHLAEGIFRRQDNSANPRVGLSILVSSLLKRLNPEHEFSMLNIERNRTLVYRRFYLNERLKEAEQRAREPIGAEPVRIRVLHYAAAPSLVLDRSSKQSEGTG